MKIVEYSKGSITEVENVFKVVESGAQGPQGEPGTIGTLDLLDPKTTPVDADLMLVGDSAASFANKKITWANVKATLKAYFDAIYQPLSTALSKITEAGGLPLWDGAAWPGGGGGGSDWDLIETRVLSGNVAEEFTIGAFDVVKFEINDLVASGSTIPTIRFSVDGGVSYPNTHHWSTIGNRSGSAVVVAQANQNQKGMYLTNIQSTVQDFIYVEVRNLQDSGDTLVKHCYGTTEFAATDIASWRLGGGTSTTGIVNKIKFADFFDLHAMNSGTIKYFKYVGS